jgi:succinyl-diaminopimelate desuccinylase
MGITTFNVGLLSYKNNEFSATVNFRYPENVVIKDVVTKLNEISDGKVDVGRESAVLYFDPNSKMIQTLYNAYKEESGDLVNKPKTIGGGTYAKEAKNIVAFGSNFPGKEDHIHEPDEKIDLEDVKNSIQIYARAIYDLGNM